jgi:hypothetical protein
VPTPPSVECAHVHAAIDVREFGCSPPPPPPDVLVPPRPLSAQNAALFAPPAVNTLVGSPIASAALRVSPSALSAIIFLLPMPDGSNATFSRDRLWTMADGSVRLHGTVTLGSASVNDVFLLAHNGSLTGDFTIGQSHYELVQVAPALSRMQMVAVAKASALKVGGYSDFIVTNNTGPMPTPTESGAVVKMLGLYTPSFSSPGSIGATSTLMKDWANTALLNAQTQIDDTPGWLPTTEFSETNYFGSPGGSILLYDLGKAALNVWSEIGRQRNIRKADLVFIGTGSFEPGIGGRAFYPGFPAPASAVRTAVAWGFALGQPKHTFTHELGHMFNAQHQRGSVTDSGYNWEYVVNTAATCGPTATASSDGGCNAAPYPTYSNPSAFILGQPAGIAFDQPNAADDNHMMQINRVNIANLRGPAVTQDLALGAKIFAAADSTTHALVRVANHAGNAMAAPKIDFTFPEYAQGPPGPGYFTTISIIQTPAGWTCATRGGAAFAVPTASYECTTSSFAVNGEVEFELAPLALFGGGGGPFTVGAYPRNLDPTVSITNFYGVTSSFNNDDSGYLDNGF